MKFGKRLRNEAMPEWREEYLGYKKLKNLIKRLCSDDPEENFPSDSTKRNKIFVDELTAELEKVENFFIIQSDETAKRAVNVIKQLEELNYGATEPRTSTESTGSDFGKRSSTSLAMLESLYSNPIAAQQMVIKNALLEMYHLSTILYTFQKLNMVAYTKIVKKFAKNRNLTAEEKADVMKKLNQSKLALNDTIPTLLNKLDEVFQKNFPSDPTYIKLKDIMTPSPDGDYDASYNNIYAMPSGRSRNLIACGFLAGMIGGINILLFVNLIKTWSRQDQDADTFYKDHTDDAIALHFIYFNLGLPILLLNGVVVNLLIFKFFKINYRLIFGISHPILPIHFSILIGFYTMVYLLFVTRSLIGANNIPLQYQPITLILIMLLLTYWPTDTLYMHSRRWWNDSFYRILLTPYYPIQFRDFFIADQWMSMTYFFAAIGWSFCYAITGELPLNSSGSTPATTWYSVCLLIVPPVVRAVQCLRRYQMQYGNPSAYLQLVNFGKYSFSILTTVILGIEALTTDSDALFYSALLIRLISTGYSLIWDFVMDFGLGQMRTLSLPTSSGSSKKEKGKKDKLIGGANTARTNSQESAKQQDTASVVTSNPMNQSSKDGGDDDSSSSEEGGEGEDIELQTFAKSENSTDSNDPTVPTKSKEAEKDSHGGHGHGQVMIYPLLSYYYMIVLDCILRFYWVPIFLCVKYNSSLFFMYGILEVVRRVSWNFFRVEVEHVHNCAAKRVIDTGSCPLPFVTQELYEPTPIILPVSTNRASLVSSRQSQSQATIRQSHANSPSSPNTIRHSMSPTIPKENISRASEAIVRMSELNNVPDDRRSMARSVYSAHTYASSTHRGTMSALQAVSEQDEDGDDSELEELVYRPSRSMNLTPVNAFNAINGLLKEKRN